MGTLTAAVLSIAWYCLQLGLVSFFYSLTKNEFLCLVIKYQQSHFLTSHNDGLWQTLAFIRFFGYLTTTLLPGPTTPFNSLQNSILTIMSFHYTHSPMMWTCNKVLSALWTESFWLLLENSIAFSYYVNCGWWKSSQHCMRCREWCHTFRLHEIGHGPDCSATVAPCYAYLPPPCQIYRLVCLGFLFCFSPSVTSSGQWSS